MYYLKLYIDLHPQKKIHDLSDIEKIDYRELNLIESVVADQVIAEAISIDTLENEEDKIKVTKIANLKDLNKFVGNGVYIKENEPSRIYAEKNGRIYYEEGKFHIEEKITLKEVNFKTGNITFTGDLCIEGDVKPGFKVSARNLTIEGSVDNAQIIAGEVVIVKGGVVGLQNSSFCKVKGGKKVILNFIENAIVECEGPIYIKRSAMHTDIYSNDFITIFDDPGIAVGGELIAKKSIFLRVVGSKWGTTTVLKVGIDPNKYFRIKEFEAKLIKRKELLNDIDKSIEYINSVLEKEDNKERTKSKEELQEELNTILEKRKLFEKRIKRLERIIENLKNEIEKDKEKFKLDDVKIYVKDKIYPGVEIKIGLESLRIYEEREGAIIFLNEDNEIFFKNIDRSN